MPTILGVFSTPAMQNEQPEPAYSRLRTGLLQITPGDNCKAFCRGGFCKYCLPSKAETNAIPNLYSTYITDIFIAAARLPQKVEETVINLKNAGVATVVNLQERREHSFCGIGTLPSGFSYDPEIIMENDIYFFNFPIPDFGGCEPRRLLDICKAINGRVSAGKILVHCHAGHGRTGMVIAACIMYDKRMSAFTAVSLVREKRPRSVQSVEQVDSLKAFETLLRAGGGDIVPSRRCGKFADYIRYSSTFLTNGDLRLFGNIPCVIYVAVVRALETVFHKVEITVHSEVIGPMMFKVVCSDRIEPAFDAKETSVQLASGPTVSHSQYKEFTKDGLAITNVETYFENFEFLTVMRFVHYFMITVFQQPATNKDVKLFLDGVHSGNSEDWGESLALLIWLCAKLPTELLAPVSRILSDGFVRGADLAPTIRRVASEIAAEKDEEE